VTARHEAIEAMFDADTDVTINYELATRLLDAIPPHLLARLAIEQGALEAVGYTPHDSTDPLRGLTTRPIHADDRTLYRVVEP
jgi:hypothetical protein